MLQQVGGIRADAAVRDTQRRYVEGDTHPVVPDRAWSVSAAASASAAINQKAAFVGSGS